MKAQQGPMLAGGTQERRGAGWGLQCEGGDMVTEGLQAKRVRERVREVL